MTKFEQVVAGATISMSFSDEVTAEEFIENVKSFMLALSYHPETVAKYLE